MCYIVYRKSQELLVSFQLSAHCYKGYNEYFVPMQIFQKMTEQPDNVDYHTVFVLVENQLVNRVLNAQQRFAFFCYS